MTNWSSALNRDRQPGRYGADGDVGIILGEIQAATQMQFAAWPDTLDQMGAVAMDIAGVATVPAAGGVSRAGDISLLRVEPLKWWLVSPAPVATPPVIASGVASSGVVASGAASSGVGVVLDISDARCWITVTGPRAATLLAHGLPIDLRPVAFADDAVVSTAIHHVGVTLWRADDGFNLLVPRSYAASIWRLLFELAQQYGVDVR
jgi:heterotetrameric sarcosine oxidase gamma subunit